MSERDGATVIINVFDKCQNATPDLLYFPTNQVGVVVHAALTMRRELDQLNAEIERMRSQIGNRAA